ncbi:hypothetical protein ScPMuIL_001441 [Solemya velum]
MGCVNSRPVTSGGATVPSSRSRSEYHRQHRGVHVITPVRAISLEGTNIREPDRADTEVLHVEKVDFNAAANSKVHHTGEYDIVSEPEGSTPAQLVVRRGEPFDITTHFNRPYDRQKDDLRLVFEIGDFPLPSKDTHIEFILSDRDVRGQWGAYITEAAGNSLTISINTPPTCFVGKWNFRLDVVKKAQTGRTVFRYKHDQPIYILFNPWCKEDQVYFPDEELLTEYVLNDVGKIYSGTSKQITAKPWNFGQFESVVLDCAMYLLDSSGLPMSARGNVVNISRKISALANAPDDNGILVGNWSGSYSGGVSPLKWSGSVKILEEFYKTKQPVKFGQCWVFSGIVTTLCRTLGLPCRSITNFSSAHDCDGSISIDVHWTKDWELMEDFNADSIWNFHVWNEGWMARPDLQAGYGGWQAIDATPQETSDGVYCTGPASVAALKNGDVHLAYDGQFVFAEVNADRVHWIMDAEGNMEKGFVQKRSVGKNISTKRANCMVGNLRNTSFSQDTDRDDVTHQYKYPEDSNEERAAVRRANLMGSTMKALYETSSQDVSFDLVDKEVLEMGEDFDVVVRITNNSNEVRTINGTMTVATMYYTGVPGTVIKSEQLNQYVIRPRDTKDMILKVKVDDYLDQLIDHCNMKMSCLFIVAETKQVFGDCDGFRLRKPHLTLKAPHNVKVGEKFTTEVTFVNPLPTALTSSVLEVEGPGLQKPVEFKQGVVAAKQTFVSTVDLTPVKRGQRKILVTFNCKQIEGVTGYCTVNVN